MKTFNLCISTSNFIRRALTSLLLISSMLLAAGCMHLRQEKLYGDASPPANKVALVFSSNAKLSGYLGGVTSGGSRVDFTKHKQEVAEKIPMLLRLARQEMLNTLAPALEARKISTSMVDGDTPVNGQTSLVVLPKSYAVRCGDGNIFCRSMVIFEVQFFKSYPMQLAWSAEFEVALPAAVFKPESTMQEFYTAVLARLLAANMVI